MSQIQNQYQYQYQYQQHQHQHLQQRQRLPRPEFRRVHTHPLPHPRPIQSDVPLQAHLSSTLRPRSSSSRVPSKLETLSTVESLAEASLLRPNATLDAAVTSFRQLGRPEVNVSPLQGQFLSIQCQLLGARSVLQIGPLGGYSTIWLALAGARVTCLDVDSDGRDEAFAFLDLDGLDVDILLGDAAEALGTLADEGQNFDMVFVDVDWEAQLEMFEWAVQLTRPGGCIYVHGVGKALLDRFAEGGGGDEGRGHDETGEPLMTTVGRDRRVLATLVPTMSSYCAGSVEDMLDGFLLAIVR
jgi:predicted O-methyltransferase YrrM